MFVCSLQRCTIVHCILYILQYECHVLSAHYSTTFEFRILYNIKYSIICMLYTINIHIPYTYIDKYFRFHSLLSIQLYVCTYNMCVCEWLMLCVICSGLAAMLISFSARFQHCLFHFLRIFYLFSFTSLLSLENSTLCFRY